MGKAVGYIVALVTMGAAIGFVATGCKKEAAAPTEGRHATTVTPEKAGMSYAKIVATATKMKQDTEKARQAAPTPSAVPPPYYDFVKSLFLKDKGTVTAVQGDTVQVDIDGDGQPDVTLDWGKGKPVPSDVTQGAQISFTAKPTKGDMQGDHFMVTATVQDYKVG